MDYTVVRTRTNKISIRISSGGKVVVRAPYFVPQSEIDSFVCKHSAWINSMLSHPMHSEVTPEREAEMRKTARIVITREVERFSKIMGLYPTAVKITSARTRFGSCSAKNSLSFTWRLMFFPKDAIEYVVVHELAHIKHKNHGSDFWALVQKTLPDYKRRKALLK